VSSRLRLASALVLWLPLLGGCRPSAGTTADSDAAIERLFRERHSGAVVEGSGVVARLLPDDLEGSRHQRFILELASGRTLLVSHNIDLAPRVAGLTAGDTVAFRGQYEWNDRGGVVHWTHHDPDGGRPGGWLEHRGRTYR
jgi:hypothetical protein